MRRDELQHISDSILVEKFAKAELRLVKQAGLFDSFNLGSIGSFIQDFVQRNVSSDAPGGVVGSFINLIVTGWLFKKNPYLGGIATIANLLGFDITSVAMKIASKLKEILFSRGSVTLSEVNEIGKSAVQSVSGGMEANDMFYALREAEFRHSLKKTAAEEGLSDILKTLVAGNRKGRAKLVIGGLIVWTIKMGLIGAGLIAGGTLLSKMLGKEPKDPGRLQEGDKPALVVNEDPIARSAPKELVGPTTQMGPATVAPVTYKSLPAPSMSGTKTFKNDANNIWYVPVLGNDAVDTLAAWTQEVYPRTPLNEDVLLSTPSFMRMVQRFGNPYKGHYAVPTGLTSKKQVVDKFVKDLIRR